MNFERGLKRCLEETLQNYHLYSIQQVVCLQNILQKSVSVCSRQFPPLEDSTCASVCTMASSLRGSLEETNFDLTFGERMCSLETKWNLGSNTVDGRNVAN